MTQPPRNWPPDSGPPAPLDPEEYVETSCGQCGLPWRIHRDLRGGKLRCECGAWVEVPRPTEAAAPRVPVAATHDIGRRLEPATRVRHGTLHETPHGTLHGTLHGTPHETPHGTLHEADVETRRRATDRVVLELGALGVAFLLPPMLVFLLSVGEQRALLMPFSSLATGMLVLLVGTATGGWAFAALRPTRSRYFGEAMAVAGLAVALAIGWVELLTGMGAEADDMIPALKAELGLAWAVMLIGVCPAVFEELAFRGLLQQRLTTLFGPRSGILLTGTAFALAHGVTAGLPFHAAIGIYLCWLRARCGSLYPGMLLHFVYNTAIVAGA